MRVISYNLRKNHARSELVGLLMQFHPDVLCLQECDPTDLPADLAGLHLADSTRHNRLGLAVYYDDERFPRQETRTFTLKKSLHDRLLSPAYERLVGTRLKEAHGGVSFVVASFHAAPLTASNSLRRKQITAAYGNLRALGQGAPTLMVGDYNYPIFQDRLVAHVGASGYELSLSDTRTYTRYKVFRGHFDFVTSTGFTVGNVETLPGGDSDHRPILVDAQRTGLSNAAPQAPADVPA
ncbi:MAG TPA: endonuclease/exonuclease/phosphatase family protein [Microbacteriaceae bacterium]|nr:endonuclease/exonuclease/phosphatase family protein [Microbacteriaceae bacterium]